MKLVSCAIVAMAFSALFACGKSTDTGTGAGASATAGATVIPAATAAAAAGGGSCNHTETFMCVQYGKLAASEAASEKKDCEKDKGKWAPSCPATGLLGTCTNPKKGGDIQMKLYKGTFTTAAQAKKEMCADSGDVFAEAK